MNGAVNDTNRTNPTSQLSFKGLRQAGMDRRPKTCQIEGALE